MRALLLLAGLAAAGVLPAASAPAEASPTPTVTATQTPWVVYVTATPGPAAGSALIPRNVYHPGRDQPLPLQIDLPEAASVTIKIYDRNGRLLRQTTRQAPAGKSQDLWDGAADSGGLVSSGIYLVHFEGRNLNKTLKLAVVK